MTFKVQVQIALKNKTKKNSNTILGIGKLYDSHLLYVQCTLYTTRSNGLSWLYHDATIIRGLCNMHKVTKHKAKLIVVVD